VVRLAAKGQRVAAACRDLSHEVHRVLAEEFTAEEFQILGALLDRMFGSLRSVKSDDLRSREADNAA